MSLLKTVWRQMIFLEFMLRVSLAMLFVVLIRICDRFLVISTT